MIIADILRAAQPVDGGFEVQSIGLFGLPGLGQQIARDEPQMLPLPWPVAKRELGDPGKLHRIGLRLEGDGITCDGIGARKTDVTDDVAVLA